MYGYIYVTKIKDGDRYYVGKKKSKKFDYNYFGSGREIKKLYDVIDPKLFEVKMLDVAYTDDELNAMEKKYISEYKLKYGSRCINKAEGETGGNCHKYDSDKEKEEFRQKMTSINSKRCRDEAFRKECSDRMHTRYLDKHERELQSERVREAWKSPALRRKQSKKLTEYYSTHKKDNSQNNKRCAFMLNDKLIIFASVKQLRNYLISEYEYNPDRRTFNKIISDSEKGISYIPFHKNNTKLMKLTGMRIYRLDKV